MKIDTANSPIADKALPFPDRRPNAVTRQAMAKLDRGEGKQLSSPAALLDDLGL